jgi:hypothetical protein
MTKGLIIVVINSHASVEAVLIVEMFVTVTETAKEIVREIVTFVTVIVIVIVIEIAVIMLIGAKEIAILLKIEVTNRCLNRSLDIIESKKNS